MPSIEMVLWFAKATSNWQLLIVMMESKSERGKRVPAKALMVKLHAALSINERLQK